MKKTPIATLVVGLLTALLFLLPVAKIIRKTKVNLTFSNATTRVLFVVVAVGPNQARQEVIRNNLFVLESSSSANSNIQIDCLAFSYAKYSEQPSWLGDKCRVITMPGQNWTGFLKSLIPDLVRLAGYDYLFISLDDVVLFDPPPLQPAAGRIQTRFDLRKLVEFSNQHQLYITTAPISGTIHEALKPSLASEPEATGKSGALVTAIEIQATLIRTDAWECMYDLVDVEFPSGWGLDVWFYDYCVNSGRLPKNGLGIYFGMIVRHLDAPFDPEQTELQRALFQGQVDTWKKQRSVNLVTMFPEILSYLP